MHDAQYRTADTYREVPTATGPRPTAEPSIEALVQWTSRLSLPVEGGALEVSVTLLKGWVYV